MCGRETQRKFENHKVQSTTLGCFFPCISGYAKNAMFLYSALKVKLWAWCLIYGPQYGFVGFPMMKFYAIFSRKKYSCTSQYGSKPGACACCEPLAHGFLCFFALASMNTQLDHTDQFCEVTAGLILKAPLSRTMKYGAMWFRAGTAQGDHTKPWAKKADQLCVALLRSSSATPEIYCYSLTLCY